MVLARQVVVSPANNFEVGPSLAWASMLFSFIGLYFVFFSFNLRSFAEAVVGPTSPGVLSTGNGSSAVMLRCRVKAVPTQNAANHRNAFSSSPSSSSFHTLAFSLHFWEVGQGGKVSNADVQNLGCL